jgi:hypothetical protein
MSFLAPGNDGFFFTVVADTGCVEVPSDACRIVGVNASARAAVKALHNRILVLVNRTPGAIILR